MASTVIAALNIRGERFPFKMLTYEDGSGRMGIWLAVYPFLQNCLKDHRRGNVITMWQETQAELKNQLNFW